MAVLLLAAPFLLPAQQTLTVTPATLSFSAQSGSTTAQTAKLSVSTAGPAGTAVGYLASATMSIGTGWLSVNPNSGTTPAELTVTVNPSGLATGTYVGGVIVTIGGVSQTVGVSLTIGQMGATPASVSFNYLLGAPLPATQVVQISAQSGVAYNTSVTTSSGGNWLIAAPSAGTAPGQVSISLNAPVMATIAQGTYNGTVTLTPTTGSTVPLAIPVTLNVSPTPQLTVTPAALSFNYQIGGTNNQVQQTVSLASTGNPLNFGVTFQTSSGGPWLVVNPIGGVTPSSLTVGVQPSALAPGTYQGTITVTAPGATTPSQSIAVTLTVSVNPLLSLSPNALEFNYQVGTPAPAAKTITPTSTSGALNYVVTASVSSGGNWLTIGTPAGTTPAPISISANPAGLAAGTYTGTVTVTAAGAGNPPQTVPVTLKVTNDPLITVNRSVNPTTLGFNWQTGQVGPAAQVIELGTTTGAVLNYSVVPDTTSGGDWLRIVATGSATPSTISVFANTSNIGEGVYDGSITVTATNPSTGAPAPNSPLVIPVKFFVSTNPLLNVSKQSLALSSVNGAVATDTISLTSTSDPLAFTVAFTTASGGSWLTLGPASGTTPNVITVSAVPGSLAPGTYAGSITITPTNPAGLAVANSPVQIPVTLSVAAGSLVVPTTTLAFSHPQGGTAPAQSVRVDHSGAPLSFTASALTTSGGQWLSVTPSSGTTPAPLSIAVNSAQLPQGTYQGSVTIVSPGALNSPQVIPVTLTVAVPQTIAAAPATLTFSHQAGSQAPAAQRLTVTSTGGALDFNAAASTSGGGDWLKLSATSGRATGDGANLNVSIDPTGLAAGRYTGTITITAAAASNSPQTVSVTLTVTAMPVPTGIAIANAASYAPGAVAPGEIVVIGGQNMGPATLTTGRVTGGILQSTLAETQVLFDGVPAPLVYVSERQISAVVPYEVAGRLSTRLQVSYRGAVSQPLDLRVTDAAPGIFTMNAQGNGPGAILNQNGSINSASNPALRGSVVVIYATGEGATNPRGINGRITPRDPNALARPLLPVTVMIGGRQAQVAYAGSAPDLVAGALQINAVVPEDVTPGSAVPIVVTIGSASSQANVTLAVQ